MTCALDILMIEEEKLPALHYAEDRRLVLGGLWEWIATPEIIILETRNPKAAEAVYDKIWHAIMHADGLQFAEWRRDYANKGARFLAMSMAMVGAVALTRQPLRTTRLQRRRK